MTDQPPPPDSSSAPPPPSKTGATPAVANPPPRTPPLGSKRGTIVVLAALLGLGALAIAGIVVSRSLMTPVRTPARPAVPRANAIPQRPVAPQVESRIFQVTEATGRVEAYRRGEWVLVAAGDVLTQDDLVRTGNGRAILRLGRTTEIELRDRVEVKLDNISRAGASVDLRRGRLVAKVGRSGDNVAITAARTRTANEGGFPARFVVTADERGRVAVATTEGSALFESAGRAVSVPAGSVARAEPGQPPNDPERISEEIFLNVTWPAGDRRDERAPVAGRAAPGAVVRVNGTQTDVDGQGHFAASVPLKVGPNPIEVEVEDVSGRSKVEKREIRKIPTKAPELKQVPTELWKNE